MGKISIIDEIQAPYGSISVNFTGKNPFQIFGMIPGLLKNVMKITGKDTHELDVRWDTTSDPREFYGVWKGKRKDDRWSTAKITIILQGKQDLKSGTGSVRIEIKGTVETEYEYSNFFQRAVWWFFNRSFYYKQRRNYIDLAQDNIFEIRKRLLDTLGILKGEYVE